MSNIEEILERLPNAPGVYLMKDAEGEVIYVGKAKNLRSRVRSYFRKSQDTRMFLQLLVSRIADIEFVVTENETEALILENNFIKQFQPRYNIRLRDEKTYISLKINLNDPFPRIQFPNKAITRAEAERRKSEPGVMYFGPYASGKAAHETVRFINSIFPIRKCKATERRSGTRPCIYSQIGLCMGPCSGKVDEAEYRAMIDDVILLLQGKNDELLNILRDKMKQAADDRDYEQAALIRDQIRAIEQTVAKQKITADKNVDRDVFGFYREGEKIFFQAMFVRQGRLEDVASYEFDALEKSDEDLLAEFLERFYGQLRFVPPEVLVPVTPPDSDTLEHWLSEQRQGRVDISVPQRGVRRELVEMAGRNARSAFEARHTTHQRAQAMLESLQKSLELSRVPQRIECFDISNFGGKVAVGALVAFHDAAPDKSHYRHYKIKTVEGQDDFAMLREMLSRRYREKEDLPDLILVDGGAGQVSAVMDVLRELGLASLDLVGIAKAHTRLEIERFHKSGRPEPIILPRDSGELLLLERVRDEAHRFAITFHRKLRARKFIHSPLEGIPGLGEKRADALRSHFGTYKAIMDATAEQLAEVRGIAPRLAKTIYDHFHAEL